MQAKVLTLLQVVEEENEVAFSALSKSVSYQWVTRDGYPPLGEGPRPVRMSDVITNRSGHHSLSKLLTENGTVTAFYECSQGGRGTCAQQKFVFQDNRIVGIQNIFLELE